MIKTPDIGDFGINSLPADACREPLPPICQKIIAAARSSWTSGWFNREPTLSSLKSQIVAIEPRQLKIVLEKISEEADGKEIFEKLSHILPRQGEAEAAKDMVKEALDYLDKTNCSNASFNARLFCYINTCQCILESFLGAFGIAEFFAPIETKSDAKVKAQTMMMLLQFSVFLTTMAVPLFGASTSGVIVGCVFLTIWILSLVYPYLMVPANIPFAENWTEQYRMGKLAHTGGRKLAIDEIANTLIASKAHKLHPLLLGQSGVGKTETAKAFVAAITRGDYPELKGKTVFYLNTAGLVDNLEGSRKLLYQIKDRIGRHEVILIFDEIHRACQDNNPLGDQLKTLLDDGPETFPYLIGITTKNEFNNDIDPAFARRFKPIEIQSTSRDETIQIAHQVLLKKAPNVLIAAGALEDLATKTETAFGQAALQPTTTLNILSQCIQKTTRTAKSEQELKIAKLSNDIDILYPQRASRQGEIAALKEELAALKITALREREDLKQFYRNRDQLTAIREEMYQTVLNIEEKATDAALNKWLFLHEYLIPSLERDLVVKAEKLGIKTIINANLIDEVLQEELYTETT